MILCILYRSHFGSRSLSLGRKPQIHQWQHSDRPDDGRLAIHEFVGQEPFPQAMPTHGSRGMHGPLLHLRARQEEGFQPLWAEILQSRHEVQVHQLHEGSLWQYLPHGVPERLQWKGGRRWGLSNHVLPVREGLPLPLLIQVGYALLCIRGDAEVLDDRAWKR